MPVIEVNNIKEAKIYFMNHNKPANTCVGKWKSESRFLKNLSEALRFYGYGKDGIKEEEEMKLMDDFAGRAMLALLGEFEASALAHGVDCFQRVAKISYQMANEMLKERQNWQ